LRTDCKQSAASAVSDAITLPDGAEREALLKKAQLAEAGAKINAWLTCRYTNTTA
jgi:hypothetical protein